jgi:hypothetical protein
VQLFVKSMRWHVPVALPEARQAANGPQPSGSASQQPSPIRM